MNIKAEKTKLRQKIKSIMESPDGKATMQNALRCQEKCEYCSSFLKRIPSYQNAKTVFAYVSMVDEFPTYHLLRQIIKDGKALAIPKVNGKDLVFQKVGLENNEISPLEKGAYGIMEPSKDAPSLFPCDKETLLSLLPIIILVPGRAFTKDGNRLGHGGGFYDRFFASLFKEVDRTCVSLVGICFSFQILPSIPRGRYDILVDCVFTEKV